MSGLSDRPDVREQLIGLREKLMQAKNEEELAKTRRIQVEKSILALLPEWDKGSQTFVLDKDCKLVVKRGLNYKADLQAIDGVMQTKWPGGFIPPIKSQTKKVLDEDGYEWYRENHPGVFLEISKHVTVTPAKPTISIK